MLCQRKSPVTRWETARKGFPLDYTFQHLVESTHLSMCSVHLTATDQQTSQWLQKHRFGAHLRIFNSFCGADLLRLTRDDLIQICGLADGIRLFNALHAKSLTPALTLYLTPAPDMKEGVFRALYLNSLTCGELSIRIAAHVGLSPDQINDVFIEGPGGIRVLVTDDVVRHMNNEALYIVEVCQDHTRERFCLLLKPTTK
ncbi:hypothetical protein FOCC_FOCC000679 [Frankliniella occidentalis]|nr:hypothetical protein FOCC_FOCC000679 [Frankliniella occidentalis]